MSGGDPLVVVDVVRQRLHLYRGGEERFSTPISTAANGTGEQQGSHCTPRGWHQVRARIGEGCAVGTVFVGRRPTGEIYTPELARRAPARDWILTRILWLSGLEPGRNRLGEVDTMRRYIYLHGTPDEANLGRPVSHGCIRMGNEAIITLFAQVPVGTRVYVGEMERPPLRTA